MKGVLLFAVVLSSAFALGAGSLPLEWTLGPNVRRQGRCLLMDVPERSTWVAATAKIDLRKFPEGFEARIRCSGKDVSAPPETWQGLKFMIRYTDANGTEQWPQAARQSGTFDWKTLRFAHAFPCGLKDGRGTMVLGLQNASGRLTFDLDSLELRPVQKFNPPTADDPDASYVCPYSDECRSISRRRGVMLPERQVTEDDFRTLKEWGVTLVRYQMVRNWMLENDNRDLAEYNAWLDAKLDHLDRTVLPLAEKNGISVVVDLHVTPGGKSGGELNMFYEDEYAAAFLDCWRKIARRFKGRKGVYGYDLVNEPCQTMSTSAGSDWWNLQRRAAEAIRTIDPDVPVVVESNAWDSPSAFAYMRPLRMTNVIYQVHLYHPSEFTHQGLSPDRPAGTVWPDASKGWNRELLVKTLEPVRAFEKAHGAKIYVGEFSAIAWAKGADQYLRDCISIFEEYGWDWSYHAFREYDGWSVEYESTAPGVCRPSADNPRKRALLDGLSTAKVRVVDFGAEGVGGYPVLTARHVNGPARIRLSYATHPNGLGPKGDFWHETRATYLGEEVALPILPASTDRFDVFDVPSNGTYRAPLQQGLVRYVRIEVESGAADVDVAFDNRGTHSTEQVVGSFECSDPELTKIWRASVRTCQLAAIPGRGTETLPYLSDGAKRDRLVWSGDLWWAQRNMYAAFGPSSPYLPGSLDMLAENQTPAGYVNACPYPESRGPITTESYGPFGSDEFAAWFVPVLADHYFYTGDKELLKRRYPNAVRVMDYLARYQDANGLFSQRPETAKHSEGLAVGGTSLHHRTYMHLLLWRANMDAARLATWMGRSADARRFAAAADRLAVLLRKRFFRPALGRFGLSLEQPDAPAFTANAAALAFGFLSGDEAKGVLAQLSRHEHGKFQMMAMRGAFELRDGEKAIELLNAHNWRAVVSDGWQGTHLTSECMNLLCEGWGDEAHPDTALAGVFTDYILGVRPTAPGYATYVVDPIPVPGITWARGVVTTACGRLQVEWSLKNGRVEKKVVKK